tara:strand:- start:42 stop:377 length:336 start_codon:yes stop_codon:yes gene_type:complete
MMIFTSDQVIPNRSIESFVQLGAPLSLYVIIYTEYNSIAMTQWEYKVVRTKKEGAIQLGKSVVDEDKDLNGVTIDDAFNWLGQKGWELVTAQPPMNVNHSYVWYTFKRPIE